MIRTKGKCLGCQKIIARQIATRHIASCEKLGLRGEAPTLVRGAQPMLIKVVANYVQKPYWMYLLVPGSATLYHLDTFLRQIWLECCGHLSAFAVGGELYFSLSMEPGDRDMDILVSNVFHQGEIIRYEYDFGTTTELTLELLEYLPGADEASDVRLLIRNEAPESRCSRCETPATEICSMCGGPSCEACVSGHVCDCADEDPEDYFLPLVNSPRTGCCGYTGEIPLSNEAPVL